MFEFIKNVFAGEEAGKVSFERFSGDIVRGENVKDILEKFVTSGASIEDFVSELRGHLEMRSVPEKKDAMTEGLAGVGADLINVIGDDNDSTDAISNYFNSWSRQEIIELLKLIKSKTK